jgi:ribosome-associated protein
MAEAELQVTDDVAIPLRELAYRATTGGGPGGQHVNRSATRVEVTWNVAASPALAPDQRALLLERLATRLDKDGTLRLVAGDERSQYRNRREVTERLRRLIADALHVPEPRRRTRPPRRATDERLASKKRRSGQKRQRRPPEEDD